MSEMWSLCALTRIGTCNDGDAFGDFWRGDGLAVPLGHPAVCMGLFAWGTVDSGALSQRSLLPSLQVLKTLS